MNDNLKLIHNNVNLLDYSDFLKILHDAGSKLTPRERTIMINRFENKMSLGQIGAIFNVSRERIRQIQNKALRKLRIKIMN